MKAIILDMYGVIAKQTGDDFVPYVQQTFPNLTREEIQTPWFQADEGILSSLDVWRILGFEGDLEQVEKVYLDTIELMEGFHTFATKMREHYKLAIISNDSSRWSKYIREKFEINQYFDVISISGDLKMAKPNPDIFKLTMEKLGCEASECVYVDDRRGNLNVARNLGMKTVLFGSRNTEYDGDVVNDFKELEHLLISEDIQEVNKSYWNTYADLWFGTTALPTLGVHFPTEEQKSFGQ